ncbi:hypothetical protein DPMN_094216 [Dreissena polymorpha]|uniref:Uncharacterized protein n=1 Tax=Dreissena polymorpha TaxID=45954 RepID=A0A9D4R2N7_DREPO|nr:hypothetical protein DPMN_094216 [Dreissena polymorpha]
MNPLRTCQSVVKEITIVFQVFLKYDHAVAKHMFHCTPPSPDSSIPYRQQFLGLTF